MTEPNSYLLTVSAFESLSPHLKRVVFTGESLRRFPSDFEGGYVKLLFPKDGVQPEGEAVQLSQFIRRSFTVRAASHEQLTVWFAEHDADGPAMRWLARTRIGESVRIAGPGPVKRLDPSAPWFLLASDMTGLAALEVNLERLEPDARGHAFVEVLAPEDRRPLAGPPGIEITWIVNAEPSTETSPLADAVVKARWHSGVPSVWVAAEFSAMRRIRRYLRDARGLTKDDMYISSYWKLGDPDEGHKAAKKADTDA